MNLAIRQLALADMDQVAVVHRLAFDTALPWLIGLHTPAEDRAFYREHVFATCSLWGAEVDSEVVGFIATRPGWIDQFYILPSHQRQSIGSVLLAHAKSQASTFSLWTFQRNTPARRFYEHHGFRALQTTDGAGNEEREPDVMYRWMG